MMKRLVMMGQPGDDEPEYQVFITVIDKVEGGKGGKGGKDGKV